MALHHLNTSRYLGRQKLNPLTFRQKTNHPFEGRTALTNSKQRWNRRGTWGQGLVLTFPVMCGPTLGLGTTTALGTAQPHEEGGGFCPWEQTFSSERFLLFPTKFLFSRTEAITFACVFSK